MYIRNSGEGVVLEEGKLQPESVQPIQVADAAGNPAPPAIVNPPQSKRKKIIIIGILVLILIITGAILVFWVFSTQADPIIGTWSVEPAGLQMQFDANGMATLRYPATGDYATGRWEKVAENRYHLLSAKGVVSPPLTYDSIADTLHTDDFSLIFVRKGG
jgi:hypothetical protein